jgi:uncharacterized protein
MSFTAAMGGCLNSLHKWIVGVGVAALLVSQSALCQQPSEESSQMKAAAELFGVVGGAKLAEAGAQGMMSMVRNNPELAPYEDVFREWYKKVFAQGEFEKQILDLYANAFSEEELRGLIDFYKSPLGAKALEQMPALMRQGMAVGERLAQKHAGELQEMLAKAKKEREAAKPQSQ